MNVIQQKLIADLQEAVARTGRAIPAESFSPDLDVPSWMRQLGLDETELLRAQAETFGLELVEDLPQRPASAEFLQKIPISYARKHGCLGLASDTEDLPVVVSGFEQLAQLDTLCRYLGRPIHPLLASASAITSAINAAYQQRTGEAQTLIDRLDASEVLGELRQLEGREDLLDNASRAPVIKLVNLLLFDAVQQQASDVHIQPHEQSLVARFRIDGILFDAFQLPRGLQDEIISRVKVLGRMNIAEKRLAQDGRATVQVGDRCIDLRISTLPTSFGERAVIRLLDKSARLYNLSDLGMQPLTLSLFRQLISLEHGLILVTGPTGSGKTTTLYAALQEIDRREHNILTLEDPIEYQLEGISQTQVSSKKGMTFASGLRSVLRQDPDIIMVGEIRDHETAVMAIQSALTGHLVFSTLHTNDAASAVTRLLDLGIEPYLVASSVIGVMAQRLVRRVCPKCMSLAPAPAEDLRRLGVEPDQLPNSLPVSNGCSGCRQTGYNGRVGIFELLVVDEDIRRQIQTTGTASQIKAVATAGGMKILRDDGLAKVGASLTTIDEVIRVTMRGTA